MNRATRSSTSPEAWSVSPTILNATTVAVRAIGTEFVVRHAPRAVDVLVTEGHVTVERAAAPDVNVNHTTMPESVSIRAGGFVTVPLDTAAPNPLDVTQVSSAEIETALAWREKRVEFSGTPLGEAVHVFNRQNRIQLTFAQPALASLRVSGIFWADNPASFARLLEISFDVSAEYLGEDRIVLREIVASDKAR